MENQKPATNLNFIVNKGNKMGKLHELLAVEASNEAAATALIGQTTNTFKSKENLFKGKARTLQMFGKNEQNQIEMTAIEAKNYQNLLVSATIPDSLNYMACVLADYYDVVAQKELTNQLAKADVVIDGKVIIEGVPATFLLGMETKLKTLRNVLDEIPTMAPGMLWKEATEIGRFIYKTDPIRDIKTEKMTDHKMLPQPNPNIPVQYVPIESSKNVGEYTEVNFTGLINSADKAKLIERLDSLLKAVKQARQRANNVDASTTKVGDKMMGYLLGAWYDRSKMNVEAKV